MLDNVRHVEPAVLDATASARRKVLGADSLTPLAPLVRLRFAVVWTGPRRDEA